MQGSPRDPTIAEEIKKIITDDIAWDAWRLRKELKVRGVKGVGDNQVMRCGELAGFDAYAHYVGSTEAISKIKQKHLDETKKESKPKSKTYKHPKGSDRVYKSMLSLDGLSWLDKEAGIYGICIDNVRIYVGQSLHVDERNINDFFNPQFIERRDFLDVDLRDEYFYIYNPSYDDKIRDELCLHYHLVS